VTGDLQPIDHKSDALTTIPPYHLMHMLQNKLQMVTFTYKNCSTSCSAGAKSSSVCYNNIIFLVFAEPLGNTTIRQMPFSFPNHEC